MLLPKQHSLRTDVLSTGSLRVPLLPWPAGFRESRNPLEQLLPFGIPHHVLGAHCVCEYESVCVCGVCDRCNRI